MMTQTRDDHNQPYEENGEPCCPCGATLRYESSSSSQDDTALGTTYACDAGHRWVHAVYRAWPSASGWYRAPTMAASA